MKTLSRPYQCPLGRVQPEATDLEAVKREGWREQHILVVSESDERLDFMERQLIHRIGEKLFGSKGKSHG